MNEFSENRNEIPKIPEFSQPSEHQNFSFDDLMKEVNTFVTETNKFVEKERANIETKETINEREYGLKECCDTAKQIFTRETLSEWPKINTEQRNQKIQEYAKAIGEGLNIDFKSVEFEKMKDNIAGYNNGDGVFHLNENLLRDSSRVIDLINTTAHEARHQFQFEAIKNPEKFGIAQATINEWKFGLETYTTQYATKYDPWGYHHNPVELDARYFGESVVRELRKDLINNSDVNFASVDRENFLSKNDTIAFTGSSGYHDSWAKSKAKDAIKHSEQIAKEKSKIWQDYERNKAKDYTKAAAAEQKKADAARKAEEAKKKGK